MRLIDADALLLRLSDFLRQEASTYDFYGNLYKCEAITDCMDAVESAETIIGEDLSDIISRTQAIERLIRLTGCKTNEEITARMDASVTDSEGWLGGVAACIDELEDMPGELEAKK
ncbi:MAG: hypothetical protein IJG86_00305 [Clostridia bacterium]|nr:hypothetical protein [Clostridia bacterium]